MSITKPIEPVQNIILNDILDICELTNQYLFRSNNGQDDWQRDGLLDNCGDEEAAAEAAETASTTQRDQVPGGGTQHWWQINNTNSFWKQRLRQSVKTLRHLSSFQQQPQYSVNDEVTPSAASKTASGKAWPLDSIPADPAASAAMMAASTEDGIDIEQHHQAHNLLERH